LRSHCEKINESNALRIVGGWLDLRRVGAWLLNEVECTLARGDTTRQLSPRSAAVLVELIDKCGQVVTNKALQDKFWPNSYSAEHGLHKAISEIRTALEDDPRSPRYIRTFARRGYSFIRQEAEPDLLDVGQPREAMQSSRPPSAPGASVAVLPFVNISGNADDEYFSDGLTEELLNVLTNVTELKVAARTSSFHFKGRTGDIAEIARCLGVATVLEGSVRRSGSRLRITAQLINAVDGYHLWSETFDRVLDDTFAVEDELALAVAKALSVRLLDREGDRLSIGGTNNNEAFQAYLRGEHLRNRGDHKDLLRASIEAYGKAVRLDPGYAKAHIGLARAWSQMALNSFASYEEGIGNLQAGVRKALELAPQLAEAHLTLGKLHFEHKQDIRAAEEAFGTALALAPGKVDVQLEYSRIQCYQRHFDEGVAAARKALSLDPVSLIANHFLGHILYFSRRYEEAISAFRHTLAMDPKYPKPHYFIAMSLYWLGEIEAAWDEVQREPMDWMRWTGSAAILHRLRRFEEAEENLAKLNREDEQEFAAIQRADVYAQWGRTDEAFQCLEQALHYGDPGLCQLLVDPFLDPLSDDPRFHVLLRKLGFALRKDSG
jgi:TolB-like protein/thioredoxin-like negative regulator of GroEL